MRSAATLVRVGVVSWGGRFRYREPTNAGRAKSRLDFGFVNANCVGRRHPSLSFFFFFSFLGNFLIHFEVFSKDGTLLEFGVVEGGN